jgi:hypothetical protein
MKENPVPVACLPMLQGRLKLDSADRELQYEFLGAQPLAASTKRTKRKCKIATQYRLGQ